MPRKIVGTLGGASVSLWYRSIGATLVWCHPCGRCGHFPELSCSVCDLGAESWSAGYVVDARRFAGALLFDTDGNFLFQRRDDKPGILHPGRIGMFGGHQESGESPLECVVREVHEELSHFVPPHRFSHLGTFKDDRTGPTRVIEIFMARALPVSELIVTEGALMVVPRAHIASLNGKLTPSAAAALDYYFADRAR